MNKHNDGPYCVRIPNGIMTMAGPERRIVVNEKKYRFERDYSGCPWLLNKKGDPTNTPSERHPFWKGFNLWVRQGCRLDGNLCLWDAVPKATAKRIGKRTAEFIEIPDGWREEDGIEHV